MDPACESLDPDVVDACLEEHALCLDCLGDSEQAYACKDAFDACIAGA
jgi:hypothetical protein